MSEITSIVAKFHCYNTSTCEFGNNHKCHAAELRAVYGTNGENKDFTDATPTGKLDISFAPGTAASEFLKPGKRYYLTFTEAPSA